MQAAARCGQPTCSPRRRCQTSSTLAMCRHQREHPPTSRLSTSWKVATQPVPADLRWDCMHPWGTHLASHLSTACAMSCKTCGHHGGCARLLLHGIHQLELIGHQSAILQTPTPAVRASHSVACSAFVQRSAVLRADCPLKWAACCS